LERVFLRDKEISAIFLCSNGDKLIENGKVINFYPP
jgi:hypothetical protein